MVRQWWRVGLLCLLIVAALGFKLYRELSPAESSGPPPRQRPAPFASRWQSESNFIAIDVCSQLVGMSLPPGSEFEVELEETKAVPIDHPVYEMSVKLPDGRQLRESLSLDNSIWDPQTYTVWCQALKPLSKSATTDPDGLLAKLTDPRPAVLAEVDRQLSKQNAQGDANWHDEAALLLVAFSLREPAGNFFQIRQQLDRICAHLAMADALRGSQKPGPCHLIARAGLACLYRNEADAQPLLATLPEQGPAAAWKRALKIRLSGDYRIRIQGSLLEERERYLAEFTVRSCAGGWKHRPARDEWKQLTDWHRFANSIMIGHNDVPGIGLGHELIRVGLPREMGEIQQVWQAEGWGSVKEGDLADQLNYLGPQSQAVIGKALWADFLQRQLMHVAVSDWLFLHDRLGDPVGAQAYAHKLDQMLSKLRLYPLLLRRTAWDEAGYHQALDQAGKLIRSQPEMVPSYAWNWLFYEPDDFPLYRPGSFSVVNEWHSHNPLPGTAYDLQPRMNHPSFFGRGDFIDKLSSLNEKSPHDPVVYCHLLEELEKKGLSDQDRTRKILQATRDYNADAAFRTAQLSGPEAEQWMRRAIALNPRYLSMALGDGPVPGEEAEYEKDFIYWLEAGPDPVEMANLARPMIQIYEHSGRTARASELAKRAASTGSSLGLCAQADLLEGRGKIDQALEVYAQMAERYNTPGPLIGALQRATAKNPRYQGRLEEALADLPGGLQPYKPLSGAPSRGVLVTSDVEDLKKNDIIVAVRGYAVHSQQQYVAIRDTQMYAEFKIWLYRDGAYLEQGPYPPHHRFGNLKDYQSN